VRDYELNPLRQGCSFTRAQIPSPQSFAVHDNGVSQTRLPPGGEKGHFTVAKAMAEQKGLSCEEARTQNMCFLRNEPTFFDEFFIVIDCA